MPKRAEPALWPAGATGEWGAIQGYECRLKSGSSGLVLYFKDRRYKDLKLPVDVHARVCKLAEHLGVQSDELPKELVIAAVATQGRDEHRSDSRSHSPPKDGDALGLQYDLLTECQSTFYTEEATAQLEGHSPQRRRARSLQKYSPSTGWSKAELKRTGHRHGRTRDVTYPECRQNEAELQLALERENAACMRLRLRHDGMQRSSRKLQGIIDLASGELNRQCVAMLQQALLELLLEEDEPLELENDDTPGEMGEVEAVSDGMEMVLFEALASIKGAAGRLTLGPDMILWGGLDAPEPSVRVPLKSVRGVSAKCVQLTPFSRAECCTLEGEHTIRFDFLGVDGRELSERFRIVVEEAIVTAAATIEAAESATANGEDMVTTTTQERPLTARQRIGAELRIRLQEVVRLQSKNKTKEAAAAMAAIPKGEMNTGARVRSKELRDATFSFGGLASTKDIVARFLQSPEQVRLLLPEEFQQKNVRAKDAEVERRLLGAAKSFFSDLMKVRAHSFPFYTIHVSTRIAV